MRPGPGGLVWLVYAVAEYPADLPGRCVGCAVTLEGARQVIAGYRRQMGTVGCDVVAVRWPEEG